MNVNNNKWIRNVFFICYLFSMYLGFTDILYVGLILSYVMIALGFYCLYLTRKNWPPFIQSILCIMLLFVFYFVIGDKQVYIPYEGLYVSIYKDVIIPNLQIVSLVAVMYYLGRYKKVDDKFLIFFLILIIPYSINKYMVSFREMAMMQKTEVAIGEVTNSAGYIFAGLLPFLFLMKKRILPIVLFLAILFGVIMSGKRGAILITFVFAVYYIYAIYLHGKFSIKSLILAGSFLFLSFYVISEAFLNSDFLYGRYEMTMEGYSSSRDTIALKILGSFFGSDSSFFKMLFGGGMGQSVQYAGNWAHNEWLELLSMSGFFGLLVYLSMYIAVFKTVLNVRHGNNYLYIFVSCSLMLFVKSFFSMTFFLAGVNLFPLFIMMGYSYGVLMNQKKRAA